jgi:hypothetical protein
MTACIAFAPSRSSPPSPAHWRRAAATTSVRRSAVTTPPPVRERRSRRPASRSRRPKGRRFQSARGDGYLPWFAKFGVFVRGRGDVVIRVPAVQHDTVSMAGWGADGDDPPRTDILLSASRCWTAYPGGLVFSGRQCVRLVVEGPGALRGAARFGLRRACGPETLTRHEQFVIARAELVFAAIALADIDRDACVEQAGARRCGASGEAAAAALVDVLRSHPDGVYELRDEGDVTVRELVAQAADDLREHRPALAARLDAAL